MTGAPRDFKNKVVLITGGGSGVGLECAKAFAAEGANIIIIGRNEDKLRGACTAIGADTVYGVGSVSDNIVADRAMALAKERFGRAVDILVNNAGTILRKTAQETSDPEWAHIMETNVTGVFVFSRAYAQQAPDGGSIVNMSSTCGHIGAAGLAAYCASKGAVDQLTRSMALELAPRQITVNAVAPGAINSPMLFSKRTDGSTNQSVIENNLDAIPLGTIAEPAEVARSVLYLAREKHITGTILSLDGGYTAQ